MLNLVSNDELYPQPEAQEPVLQVDRCYYKSALSIVKRYTDLSRIYYLRFFILLFVWTYDLQLRKHLQTDNPCVPYLLFALVAFQIARASYSNHILKTFQFKIDQIQTIATNLGHSKPITSLLSILQDPFQQMYIWKNKSKLKVSRNIYSYNGNLAQNNERNIFAMEIQFQKCQSDFERALKSKWLDLFELVLTVIMIELTFIILEFYEPQMRIIFLVYLLSEFYLRSRIFVVMTLLHICVALLPLCCLCLCYYDRRKLKQFFKDLLKRSAKLPEPILATSEIIQKTQGTCSICIEDLIVEQKVINLKCSEKHVFHEVCIQDWSKIRKNCPICRADI